MASFSSGSACGVLFGLLLTLAVPGFSQPEAPDTSLFAAGIADLTKYLDSEEGLGKQVLRLRLNESGFEQTLRLNPIDFLQFSSRSTLPLRDDDMAQRFSMELRGRNFSLIHGYGYVHIAQGLLAGRTMTRQGSRISRFLLKNGLRTVSDASFWNPPLTSFTLRTANLTAVAARYDEDPMAAMLFTNQRLAIGTACLGGESPGLEIWAHNSSNPRYVSVDLAMKKPGRLSHANLAGGVRGRTFDAGINLLFRNSFSDSGTDDSPWGRLLPPASIGINTGLWKRISPEFHIGGSLISIHSPFQRPQSSLWLEMGWARRPHTLRIIFKQKHLSVEKDSPAWPFLPVRARSTSSELILMHLIRIRPQITVRSDLHWLRTQTEALAWALRLEKTARPFGWLIQFSEGFSSDQPLYLPRPYLGSAVLSRRISDPTQALDIRLNSRRKFLLLSLLCGISSKEVSVQCQLQMVLR